MIDFLRSEDALSVYSNYHNVLAMSNLFKIHIHIFTYNGDNGRWSRVSPDPIMSDTAEIKFGPRMQFSLSDATVPGAKRSFFIRYKDSLSVLLIYTFGGFPLGKLRFFR